MKKLWIYWVVFGVLLVMSTCKHKPDIIPAKKPGTPVDTTHKSNCSPDTVYFYNTILPLITSNCAMPGCHDAITHKEGLNLTTYSNIIQYVSPGNAANSWLYRSMTGSEDMMPPSGRLSQAQLDAFYKWIQQGAKNNRCTESGNCDTTNVSYNASIVPIISTYCKGCHNSSNSSGSVNLDNYNGVLTVVNNGQLMGGLTGKLSPMPKYGQPLSVCNFGMFRQWINEGARNN